MTSQCKWKKKNEEVMNRYGIQSWELSEDKSYVKSLIRYRVHQKFKETMSANPENKSKLAYYLEKKGQWHPELPESYMKHLTRKQVSTIFKTRARMIRIKGNYKNAFNDLTYRANKSGLIRINTH